MKELYEKKLERVNDLFMELNAWKLQLVSGTDRFTFEVKNLFLPT